MTKLNEFARDYESKATKNIAELPEVFVDMELEDDSFEFTDKNGEVKTVKQKVINQDGEKYRVPISVIQQLKVLIEDNPEMKKFKVKKSGEGKDNTRYLVIPLEIMLMTEQAIHKAALSDPDAQPLTEAAAKEFKPATHRGDGVYAHKKN